MGCGNSQTNFRDCTTVFETFNLLEKSLQQIKSYKEESDVNSNDYKLYNQYTNKIESTINFVKDKPLAYIDDRLNIFRDIINRYYHSCISSNTEEFEKSQSELEDFILKMMDYYKGIRDSTVYRNNTLESEF